MPIAPESVPTRFPMLPTGPDGVQTVHHYQRAARLEPLPMAFPLGMGAWGPVVERWCDPDEPSTIPGTDVPLPLATHLKALFERLHDPEIQQDLLDKTLGIVVLPMKDNLYATPHLMRQDIAVALLLERGAVPTDEDLVQVARGGNPRLVQRMIQAHPRLLDRLVAPQDASTFSESPLLVVCTRPEYTGSSTIVQVLLDAGMSPDHKDLVQERSALHWAATGQNSAALWVLLERGANPNVVNLRQQTPLHYAAARNRPEAVRILIEHGADPLVNTATLPPARRTPPLLGFETPRLREPALREETDRASRKEPPLAPYRDTPLLQAACFGANATLELLLAQGEDPFPLIDSSRPGGPRDDRILGLVDDAHHRAVGDGDPQKVLEAAACRVLLERHQLRQVFTGTTDSDLPVPAEARPRARL